MILSKNDAPPLFPAGLAPSRLLPSRNSFANAVRRSNPSSGVGASPSALTSALPTMTPSAPHPTTCAACSFFEIPNPTATGLSVTFLTSGWSSKASEAELKGAAGGD
jgi:hypothetical protein|eukprot:30955-Pelagococcus_subviridis.AAC.6